MKILTAILLSFFILTSHGQQLTDKEAVYNILRTHNLGDTRRLEPAKKAFQHFIFANPTSNYKLMAVFYLAEIASRLNNPDSAFLFYTEVLAMPAPDSIENANCKNRAAKRLAEIYIAQKDYCSAINYLDLATTIFLPKFSCGNAYAQDHIEMKILYSGCYSGMGNYKKAIDILAPYMLGNGFGGNNKLVTENLYTNYLKVYTKEEIKKEFSDLQNKIVINKEIIRQYTFLHPKIKIFNNEVRIPIYDFDLKKMTEQQQIQLCIDKIRQSEIYKLATTVYPKEEDRDGTKPHLHQPQLLHF